MAEGKLCFGASSWVGVASFFSRFVSLLINNLKLSEMSFLLNPEFVNVENIYEEYFTKFIDFMKEAIKDKPSVPFRMPNSVKLVKIDKSTGKYPNPTTPKEKIFFEALKIEDEIQENEIVDEALNKDEVENLKQIQDNIQEKPLEKNLEDNQPTGIY